MTIDWAGFTPLTSLAGGALIGLAAAVLLLFNGRIAGISGILGGLLQQSTSDRNWRLAFIAGLLLAPLLWQGFALLPEATTSDSTGPADCRRPAGWFRQPARIGLYQRPRRVRHFPPVAAFAVRHGGFHVGRFSSPSI